MEAADTTPKLGLDDKAAQRFAAWYKSLPDAPGTIRIFDRKDLWTVHGEDALFVAKRFYRTTAVVKHLGGGSDSGHPCVTLNRTLLDTVLRELLIEGSDHRVEVYEGSGNAWTRVIEASPGRLAALEDAGLLRAGDGGAAGTPGAAGSAGSPVVAAVALHVGAGERKLGVAFCDAGERRLGACEFADDEHFCQLEALVAQLGPKECVVSAALPDTLDVRRMREVLERSGGLVTTAPKATFSAANAEDTVAKLCRDSGGAVGVEQHRPVLDRPLATEALCAVVAFLDLQASAGGRRYTLGLHDLNRYMRLDGEAQRALNVMKTRTDANDNFSLHGLLDRARTPMGKKLLRTWLKQPLLDLEEIGRRHDVVEAIVTDSELRSILRDTHMRGVPDIDRLCRKLERRKATLADLCQLYRASSKVPLIADAVRNAAEGGAVGAEALVSRFAEPLERAHGREHLQKFEALLEAAVDLDKIPEEYVICPKYNRALQEIADEKEQVEAEIQRLLEAAAGDLSLVVDKGIKLEWHKANNVRTRCFRITQKEEKACRKRLQSGPYVTLETRKDGTKFTNPGLRKAALHLQNLTAGYEKHQKEIVDQVVEVAATFVEVWEGVGSVLAELDVLASFAEVSACAPTPFVRPDMRPADDGDLVLKGSRHPCVEAQEGVEFISNDCVMRRGESWFQIITGPNMGGKSTLIRQVGVCVLMAQVGCFVPCAEARIPVRDAIFARVGAGDCQMRGVSTFMAEMLETASILKGASSRSLVIIDELGRGTSTYDGFGLSWAISEHLMTTIGCPTLFATHFHELTAIQGPVGVANRHVATSVDKETGRLTMLYQVRDGPCDQSFGIHVAEFASFPAEVVAAARAKAAELEDFSTAGPPLKRARTDGDAEGDADRAAGLKAARAAVAEFRALPLADAAPGDVVAKAGALVEKLRESAKDSRWLAALLEPAAQAC
ncbi:unnamed protein product [Pedinophyceae sp. YPF-701]|nr:unnamed protein product [Pedinophyceae sp. YPF-701]